jgi:tetratricopeptide (TPR) repeat protein
MASKESMVVTPLMVAAYDRVFLYPSFRAAFRGRTFLYAGLAATWLVFALLAGGTPFFSPSGFDRQISRWSYLLNQAPMIARYLRLSIWPSRLVLDYGLPRSLSLADVRASASLVLVLMALTLVTLVRRPRWGFWGLWFFVTLAPSSGIVPIPTEVGAERRMYLPLVAVIVVSVKGLEIALTALASRRRRRLPRLVVPAALLLVLTALGVSTWRRNAEYQSGIGIWQTVLDRWPHPRAHLNLAAELRAAGRHDDAIAELRIAVPDLPDARRALAFELMGKGDSREAAEQLAEFVRLKPADPEIVEAREVLAEAAASQGDLVEARHQLELVTRAAPSYATGHLKLADTLVTLKDFDAAIAQYRAVLSLQPANARALAHLGLALASKGQTAAAIDALRRALELSPEYDDARRDLIGMLLGERMYAEAEKQSRALLARWPGDAEAHNRLGVALASVGRTEEAVAEFREAVRLNPQGEEARNNLARALGRRQ